MGKNLYLEEEKRELTEAHERHTRNERNESKSKFDGGNNEKPNEKRVLPPRNLDAHCPETVDFGATILGSRGKRMSKF